MYFSRLLNTGDTQDFALNENSSVYLLYAYAPTDGDSNNNYAQHSVRGVGSINLFSGNATVVNTTVNNNTNTITNSSSPNGNQNIVGYNID